MDIQLQGSILDGIKLTRLFRGTLPASEVPTFAATNSPRSPSIS